MLLVYEMSVRFCVRRGAERARSVANQWRGRDGMLSTTLEIAQVTKRRTVGHDRQSVIVTLPPPGSHRRRTLLSAAKRWLTACVCRRWQRYR